MATLSLNFGYLDRSLWLVQGVSDLSYPQADMGDPPPAPDPPVYIKDVIYPERSQYASRFLWIAHTKEDIWIDPALIPIPEPPIPDVTVDELKVYAPQSMIDLAFQAGDSELYPMGKFYIDKSQFKTGTAGTKMDARNSIGKFLNDQTFDENNNFESMTASDMLESMLSGAGLTDFYIQPSSIYMGMKFAPNKNILGGIDEILQYLTGWKIREEISGKVVIADSLSEYFTQPNKYTFLRNRDIFSREVVADDRSTYGRICVHTSDFLIKVYRPIVSDLGWNSPPKKTLYQQVPDGTTTLEAVTLAAQLASSMESSGAIETLVGPIRLHVVPGDEAEIIEEDLTAVSIGIITQVKHTFGEKGFFTEITVDSGGRIGKPKFKEIVAGIKKPAVTKKVS